jgi:catechol 2,3-dioxygenase
MKRPVAVRQLGHVAFYVRDLAASRHFYGDILGMVEAGTGKDGRIVFFSVRGSDRPGRGHHEIACELARAGDPGPRPERAPGLYHVAFAIGDSLEELQSARRWVEHHGLTPFGETATSFCVRDPDGHMIELYVERRT